MVMFFLILALVFVVLLVIITNIVIVPQFKVYVVERQKGEPEGAGGRLSPSAGHHPR